MTNQADESRHPFLKGLSKHRGAVPTVMVIFGASGDLTARKLVPAIFNLGVDNLLPGDFHLIGYGRKPIEDEAFRSIMDEAINEFSRRPLNEEIWGRVRSTMTYHAGGYDESAAFVSLAQKIDAIEAELGREVQRLFYISTPPSVFEPIIANLGSSGLARAHFGTKLASKVIIEKPFGRDLESARELNASINGVFDESQVYRIDHYLGKETVQDLLVQRFANSIFEPLWNREYVDNVQITVAESLGVGTRGGYYDTSGALRDMIQNHTMQLVALTAMEPPVSLDPESIRDEKVKVLKAIQPLELKPVGGDVVRARYTGGLVNGEAVPAYLDAEGIPADSTTETYAALRLSINNWRWKGVPFYIRSGKRMARRASEIAIQFKRPPGILFSEGSKFDVAANTMVIRIQPDEGVTLVMNSKVPGLETRTQPVKMHFRYSTTFGSNTPEAYERLILDAMIGDSTLFIRGDETEASWKLVTPILEYWKECGAQGLEEYAAGSWGPLASEQMLWEKSHQWRKSG
ncbi:glucose-6-phosphate dehydrogenase [Coraliomargarita akajimensis]|uniref:Glucose-6-phosphate 1-dehydrogenase n=1 Tax=Coraliomargarita akajimensis (strain DSM 45221 / IAM 15411 / JCM 23193 / KCTC 12865 / 04OKA010-24) TaxID=583355 RepID=D5EM57_CORAD|nr:glucose-6-phosphate dehydrogenase [Coraliomargarita akajimensis]ADE55217.1 glucose-6-phosphate 1-dehydrogenase [Coraliomargarita akajimensis DSM 45221]